MEFFGTVKDIFLFVALLCGFYLFTVLELIEYIKNRWQDKWRYRWLILRDRWKSRWGNSWLGRNFDFTALVIVLLIFGLGGFVYSAELLVLVSSKEEEYNTIGHYVFNNPLVLAALLGFPILIRRVSETRLQSCAMQYNAANELLWSKDKGSRMAGIDALERLGDTYPKEEYHHVMDVFTQFILYPMPYELDEKMQNKHQNLKSVHSQYFKQEKTPAGKRDDINKILRYMGKERMAGVKHYMIKLSNAHLEEANLFDAYLHGADLVWAHLEGADLMWAHLVAAYLEGAHLEGANLSGADLRWARVEGAHLEGANLSGAHLELAKLEGTNLSGADLEKADLTLAFINYVNFTNAKNLTQEQIDSCAFITDDDFYQKPPILPKGIKPTYKKMKRSEWLKVYNAS